MNSGLIPIFIAFLGLVAGAVGYWITTFWMKPILRYRELRTEVFADFIFYAQVINAKGMSERMQKLYDDRVVANRRHSADLAACLTELPGWYKWWLQRCGHAPNAAVTHLIGFSNTTEYEAADKRANAIKKALGYKPEGE